MGQRVKVALAVLLLTGCAAMKRTWQFSAPAVSGPAVQVGLRQADVTQKTAFVTFWVRNISSQPVTVEAGTFSLRLPDGTEVSGKTALFDRGYDGAVGLLAQAGWVDEPKKPSLAPGKEMEVALAFRQYGRDLRRHPTLSVALDALLVNGQPAQLPPLLLHAPAEAPMGEDI
jgi:hypothetical protein